MPYAAPGGRRGLTVEAMVVACLVRAGLRVVALPGLVCMLGRLPTARRADTMEACEAAARAAVARVAHPTCLFAALVTFTLLARRGFDVTFHLGAARGPSFSAHAWLTLPACTLNARPGVPLTPLWRYRVARRAA
jgi:hypothetical protein